MDNAGAKALKAKGGVTLSLLIPDRSAEMHTFNPDQSRWKWRLR